MIKVVAVVVLALLTTSCNPSVDPKNQESSAPKVLPVLGFTGNVSRDIRSKSLVLDMTSADNYLAKLVTDNGWETLASDRTYVEGILAYYVSFCPALGGFISNESAVKLNDTYRTSYLGYNIDFLITKEGSDIKYYATLPDNSGYISILINESTRQIAYSQTLLVNISYGTPRDNFMHMSFSGTINEDNSIHWKASQGFVVNEGTSLKVMDKFEFYSAADYQGFYFTDMLTGTIASGVEVSVANEQALIALATDRTALTSTGHSMYVYLDKTGAKPKPVCGPSDESQGAAYRAALTPPWPRLN